MLKRALREEGENFVLLNMSDSHSMPSLTSASTNEMAFDVGSLETLKFRYASILAQIEIVSCFQNDVEPLF